jgi:putative transposase
MMSQSDHKRAHRKRVKHIHEPGHLHELTFSCYRRLPLLTNDLWQVMLAESIDRAIERHHYRLIAFVLMPEHVHLLVLPERDASTISKLLFAIKRPYSYRIKQLLTEKKSPLLDKLTIRQRPGVTTFRYWQEGPGYDRNIFEPKTIEASIQYIHENPVKRGLSQRAIDWKWSSARQFVFPDQQPDSDLPKVDSLPPNYVLPN